MVPGKDGAEAKSCGHPTPSFSLTADPSGSGPSSWVMHPTHCGEETPRWPAETPIQRWTVMGDTERGRLKGQARGEGWQGQGRQRRGVETETQMAKREMGGAAQGGSSLHCRVSSGGEQGASATAGGLSELGASCAL